MDMSTVLEIVTSSNPGMVRSNNEDSVTANVSRGFAVLADGMGGYNAGEVASGMATTLIGTELEKAFAAGVDAYVADLWFISLVLYTTTVLVF